MLSYIESVSASLFNTGTYKQECQDIPFFLSIHILPKDGKF